MRSPDDTWYFVAYESRGAPGDPPAIAKQAFARLQELRLTASAAVGRPWVAGRDKNERIFVAPGRYEIVVTDTLESDAPRADYRCVITYHP